MSTARGTRVAKERKFLPQREGVICHLTRKKEVAKKKPFIAFKKKLFIAFYLLWLGDC